ncbi:DUF1415 domain-containing protein [Variovorax sp. J22R133]|uniref:DUF1415 domain-containing protein n=1 Tax=Variovorax brevis TaxID=3053503 RepID=UPI0025777512|nr:DUF1415 domain-containing protein [Variovorax sp. J22R133]MDM0114436.1 DUF1415 domain-containing protein [Variovorax sp. J22R133]
MDATTSRAAEIADHVKADTLRWLEKAVIGLNLCPFAKAVHVKHQIHYAVYQSDDDASLLDALLFEAAELVAHDAAVRDTTLLIAPHTLSDFLDFNDFVARAERRLGRAGYEGVLQLASFHPAFQFAGSEADDIGNATNRSPYPTLHLLREDSVSRAVDAFPEAEAIFERNIETLTALGAAGWAALDVGPHGAVQ